MLDPKTNASFDKHEDVVFVGGENQGFAGIISIHSTVLGPAAGGCRIWDYDSVDEAVTDALRLSRGMTYKNAMADLPLGGGKAVIYRINTEGVDAFQKFGDAVEQLGGKYITAEDVGATV